MRRCQTTGPPRGERAHLDAAETRESLALGAAMHEVRVELPSHRQVVELAARLAAEGYSVVRPEGAQLSVYSQIKPWPQRSDW